MHLDSTRCLQCGTQNKKPPWPLGNNFTTYPAIDNDRNIIGTAYWLCSDECYDRALAPHIDPHYGLFKSARDHPTFKQLDAIPNEHDPDVEPNCHWLAEGLHMDHTIEFHALWKMRQQQQINSAHQALLTNIKYREEQNRIAEEQKAVVSEQRAAERDAARVQRERERDAERQRLLAERQAIQDAERRIEEEKWRPGPFNI
jgi:hypothetical protein